MLLCLLTTLVTCQDPAPAPAQPPAAPAAPAAPPAQVVETWDDKTAKAAAAELTKSMKAAASMVEKNRALEKVAAGSNTMLLKPLGDIVEQEKSVVIRKRAVQLIGNQPAGPANTALRKLLKNSSVQAHPAVVAELVRNLARCGYETKQWPEIADLFEKGYEQERVPLHEAVLDLITVHKEKQAIELLLRNLDHPEPADVHAGDNPPQEYWEARWKAWSAWKGKVKDALFAITGQRFSTATEARAWLKQNPLR